MNRIEIPTLLFWDNGNSWYGSFGNARFYIKPESVEGQDRRLSVRFWHGPMAMELSEVLAEANFPVSEDGLAQATAWLEEMARTLQS